MFQMSRLLRSCAGSAPVSRSVIALTAGDVYRYIPPRQYQNSKRCGRPPSKTWKITEKRLVQPYLAQSQELSPSGSRIITISTTLTSMSMVQGDHFLYSASKGALEQITRVLAKDKSFGGSGITVDSIAPGPVDTESFRHGLDENHIGFFKSLHPQNRLGALDDISDAVSFLAGPDSKWVNGQTLRVNGGLAV